MSNPIGDITQNPNIKGSNAQISKTKRIAHALTKGSAQNLDMLLSPGDIPMKAIGFLLKTFGSKKLANALDDDGVTGSVEGALKKFGGIEDLPKAESYGDRFAENLGTGLSSLPLAAGGGARAIASALGGIVSQSGVQPLIEDRLPSHPGVQLTANILAGLAGGGVTGKVAGSFSPKASPLLPEYTHAQNLYRENPHSRQTRLARAKQLDLGKSDFESANNLQDIQLAQHAKTFNYFPKSKIKGSEVVDSIEDAFKKAKSEASNVYKEGFEEVIRGIENPLANKFNPVTGEKISRYKKIDIDKTLDLIEEKILTASESGDIKKFLVGLRDNLMREKGNPIKLNSLKKEWGSKANYGPHNSLYVGKEKEAAYKQVIHSLTEDMKEQIPGYSELMKTAQKNIEHIDSIKNSILGDVVKTAEKKPSQIISRIFEDVDDEFIPLVKKIIPEDVYEKAAQTYLTDLSKETLGKTIIPKENKFTNYFNLRSKLENEKLQKTLPKDWADFAKNTAKDIEVSEIGLPRGDFAETSARGIATGDEVKNTGKRLAAKSLPSLIGGGLGAATGSVGGPFGIAKGAAAGAALGEGARRINTNLKRKEMLTGVSPSKQIINGITPDASQVAIQSQVAGHMPYREIPVINPGPGEPSMEKIPQDYELPTYELPSVIGYKSDNENRPPENDIVVSDSQDEDSPTDSYISHLPSVIGYGKKRTARIK